MEGILAPNPPDPNYGTPASPELTLKIKQILKTNGISDPISEVFIKGSDLSGENFAGVTEYVTVKFEDPDKKPLHLFMKRVPEKESYRQMLEELQAYKKETVFLMEYLPLAKEYCRSLGREDLLEIYPKCYYGDDEMVVLENLVTEKGFMLLDKTERQDLDAAKLALTNLAEHHAISHAFIHHLGGPTPFFEKFPQLKLDQFLLATTRGIVSPNFENNIDINIKILESTLDKTAMPVTVLYSLRSKFLAPATLHKEQCISTTATTVSHITKCGIDGATKAIEILKSFKGKAYDKAIENLRSESAEFRVINHGDYWNNNMMFLKDNETGKVISQVIIDFQTIRYASPCLELSYYLFTTVKPEVRKEKFQEMLEIYLETLKNVGEKLGHPVHLSFQELEAAFTKHFQLGFFFGLSSTTRACFEVLKNMELNLSEFQDMGKVLEKLAELVGKWVDANPEKCEEDAGNIIEYMQYYEKFSKFVTC